MNILAIALIATTTVFRLELSDEKPYIVGEDGVRREVVVVSPENYGVLTSRVDAVWKLLNSTEDGRVRLHGMRADQRTEDGWKYTIYEDGFVHRERMFVKHLPKARVVTNSTDRVAKTAKPSGISFRQWEMRKAAAEARKREPNVVTVEHNAATGKDTVK